MLSVRQCWTGAVCAKWWTGLASEEDSQTATVCTFASTHSRAPAEESPERLHSSAALLGQHPLALSFSISASVGVPISSSRSSRRERVNAHPGTTTSIASAMGNCLAHVCAHLPLSLSLSLASHWIATAKGSCRNDPSEWPEKVTKGINKNYRN